MLIHDYAADGNLSGIADELANNVDIETRDKRQGHTPLMHAVASAKTGLDTVRFLLERGADPNAVGGDDRIQETVLSLAVGAGNHDKIVLLLDAGADIKYERPGGYDVLVDAMHGHDIARDPGLLPVIRLLIERGANLNTVTEYGESALNVASNNGRFDAVKVLLDAGADSGVLGWTPLMRAITLGTLADVESQLDQGADLAARDFWGRTPWLLSLQVGDVAKAKLLLGAGAKREDRGRCGRVPLMYPVANDHVDMLRWLLSEGFHPDDADDFKTTALMQAASEGAAECVKALLEAGASIRLADHVGHEAITVASSVEVVRLLVTSGADLNGINDEVRAVLTRIPHDGRIRASHEEYLATKHRRYGKGNPERMNCPFWESMVRAGTGAWSARDHFGDVNLNDDPVWCFMRFEKSINELLDGRIVEIGGEHEDYYDPDFCIYNDVVVHHGDGSFDILGYPREVFPPTDFHTATLVGKFIYIIGSLGYSRERQGGATQVYRLDTETFAIEEMRTSGDNPGWISRHKATLRENREIHVRGGKLCTWNAGTEDYVDNQSEYVLNLDTLVWRRVGDGG